MNIAGMDRAKILVALYNGCRCPMGSSLGSSLTLEKARELLKEGTGRFDYLNGRSLKLNLREGCDELNLALYDRDNGSAGYGEQLILEAMRAPTPAPQESPPCPRCCGCGNDYDMTAPCPACNGAGVRERGPSGVRIRQIDTNAYEICRTNLSPLISGVQLWATGEEMKRVSLVIPYSLGIGVFRQYVSPTCAVFHLPAETGETTGVHRPVLYSPMTPGHAYILSPSETQVLYNSMREVFG